MPKSVERQSVERQSVEPKSAAPKSGERRAASSAAQRSPTRSSSAGGQPAVGQPANLERWIYQTIARKGLSVQYRVRGNSLHLLCRQPVCPNRDSTLLWLIPALQATQLSQLLPADAPPLYQVWVYGCQSGDKRPRWTATLYLNQLAQQLAQLEAKAALSLSSLDPESSPDSDLLASTTGKPPGSDALQFDQAALVLSNAALAKRGEEMAIACYLSETLNELGVAVRVSAKVIPYRPLAHQQPDLLQSAKRLWVACEAAYSPDAALLSGPITQKLRELEIEGFHDAVIRFQVTGERQPDWTLRVDLTPPSDMLREWARWGDLEAIQLLLNQELADLQLQITTATVNATTLHLCCSDLPSSPPAEPDQAPGIIAQRKRIKADIGLVLEAIAPQGIHATTLYGQISGQADPVWVEWLDLPASQHPAFAEPTLALARQGDWEAIAFLLHRLLNPNLNQYLVSGGIRLQLLPKQDLLHIMCEAPNCPERQRIGPKLVRFLRQLELPGIGGLRLYGRRAGQKQPLWSYGLDFVPRSRLVPEVTPEFAASDAYVEELLPQPGESLLRPDLTPADLQSFWRRWQQDRLQQLQRLLLKTQLFSFAASPEPTPILPGQQSDGQGQKVALVWGAAGLILLLQSNWVLNHVAQVQAARVQQAAKLTTTAASGSSAARNPAARNSAADQPKLKASPMNPAAGSTAQVFDTSRFTQTSDAALPGGAVQANGSAQLPYMPHSPSEKLLIAEILAEGSALPSFNSQQLDQKLQLYYRFVEKFGAPDVLIVGSSRALRGVDPAALEAALAEVGVSQAKIFNFGINGATAQVVNLLMQHLLTAQALPRLVIWADGARAFNSGAVDVTYNGVVSSEAYQQLLAGTLPLPASVSEPENSASKNSGAAPKASLNRSLTSSYESIDRWLSQQLAILTGQQARDPLKQAIQQGLVGWLPFAAPLADPPSTGQSDATRPAMTKILQSDALPDASGFLSLPVQFNPTTYYQKYARVLGSYDSDYENFRLSGNQEAALESLLKFTAASQIPVVFVNLPLTEDYLDPVRLEHEQQFRDYMVQLSLSHDNFGFRDLSEQWTTQYRYFSDPSHLNRYGAYALSLKLAQDAKIPWRKSEQAATLKLPDSSSNGSHRAEEGSS